MKAHSLHIVVALGLLVCGSRPSIAQRVSLSAPIIVQFAEIDRYNVTVLPRAKVMDGAVLLLPLQGMKQTEVEALVRDGIFWGRSIWLIDGQKVIAECRLVGVSIQQKDQLETKEYGLTLGFLSVEDAGKVAGILRLSPIKPNFDELIRRRKAELDDVRFWIDDVKFSR